jgi:hypothetical protein
MRLKHQRKIVALTLVSGLLLDARKVSDYAEPSS